MELSCSILAEEVLLVLLPLFPLPEEGPLVFATEFGGLFPPLFPFPVLFVPKNRRSSHLFDVLTSLVTFITRANEISFTP